jgi:hypothetical protein
VATGVCDGKGRAGNHGNRHNDRGIEELRLKMTTDRVTYPELTYDVFSFFLLSVRYHET